MTLGQANLLCGHQLPDPECHAPASRYMAALEEQRYVEDTQILEPRGFSALVTAYQKAKRKTLLSVRYSRYRQNLRIMSRLEKC